MMKMLQYKMYPAGELRCPTTAVVISGKNVIANSTNRKVKTESKAHKYSADSPLEAEHGLAVSVKVWFMISDICKQ